MSPRTSKIQPTTPARRRLDRQVAYRTNDEEIAAFTEAAARVELPVQAWMRRTLRRAAGLSVRHRI